VISEAREVTLSENRFSDTFEPFGVHLYTTRHPLPPLVMEKVLRDPLLSQEPKKERDPDNLAGEGNGARASSSYPYISFQDSPAFAIDGDPRTCWFTQRWGPNAGPVRPEDEDWIKNLKQTWQNDWLRVDFPRPVEVGRIEIVSWRPRYYPDPVNVLSDYEIQYLQGQEWPPLLKKQGNDQERITHTFSPVTTSGLRLIVTGGLYVAELKAYRR
jgi:hypothetical protein